MPSELNAIVGCRQPRICNVPAWVTTAGPDAVELAALAGLPLDDWQQDVLEGALGLRDDYTWAAPEIGLIVGRQNGKTTIAEVASLEGLYLRRAKLVYTAHLMITSRKMRERIQFLIESYDDFAKEIKQIRTSNEEQSIILKPQATIIGGSDTRFVRRVLESARIDFVARTANAARGWAGYDIIFFDEAFALNAEMVGSLMPIMFAKANWQIWYLSMGGKLESEALRTVRQRGIEGDPEVAYYEWSVDEIEYQANPVQVARDPCQWAKSNPALGRPSLGRHLTVATLSRAQRAMEPIVFAREVLCVFEDPRGAPLINLINWSKLADAASQISSAMIMAFDCTPGLTHGCIGVAGYREDTIPHVEITGKDGQLDAREGVAWMVDRIIELNETWQPMAWMMDATGPARAVLLELQAECLARGVAYIEPYEVTATELGQACGEFLAAAHHPDSDRLRHLNQQLVIEAIKSLQKRDIGDGAWAWGRKASEYNISPVMVLTLALHGLAVFGVSMYNMLDSVH
jgi:hypothetical protein